MPNQIIIPQRMQGNVIYPGFVLVLDKPLMQITYRLPDLGGSRPTLHEDNPDSDERIPA